MTNYTDYSKSIPYMVGHFIYNLWAAPWQDNQTWNRLARVTPFGGSRNYVKVITEEYNLPSTQDRYHCYMVGQVNERIYNLPYVEWTNRSDWLNMVDVSKSTNVFFQFYTKNGIVIPLNHVFMTVTLEKNVIFVVKEDTKIPWDMNSEDLYFRTYNNVLHHVDQKLLTDREVIDVAYGKILRAAHLTPLYEFMNKYRSKGQIFCYVNGVLVNDIGNYPVLENDVVELIYDSTITKVIEIPIGQLPTFKSKVDLIRKYLFTHNKTYHENLIEYHDDCDFHLCAYPLTTPYLFRGVLLHKNDKSNVRQVTNSDFSISTNLVKEMMDNNQWIDEQTSKVVFRVYYRKQYDKKVMPFVANRLHELNKLDFANRVGAMIGLRSNIEMWKAENLESSMVSTLMSLSKPICDLETVQNAYGYNAINYYAGKSVHPYSEFLDDGNGGKLVNVPYEYRKYCTIFEYDSEGKLLEWRRLGDFFQYPVVHSECRLVEFVSGIGTRQPQYGINAINTPVPSDEEFRVYCCLESLKYDVTKWKDITHEDGAWVWATVDNVPTVQLTDKYPLTEYNVIVKTDKYFICQDIDVAITKGTLQFTMNMHFVSNGQLVSDRLKVPYGFLDVYLNGYSLIEGIDYFVKWPNVVIVNKGRINLSLEKQHITYRLTNFPVTKVISGVSQLTGITENRQVGYVNHYELSRNKQYDILDDKNFLIKVGNGVVAKETLGFSERGNVILERKESLEGKPYEIRDIIVPKRDVYVRDTYEFKEESDKLDKEVSDYLNQFFTDAKYPNNPPIEGIYFVYSPTLSRIIYDLSKNQLDIKDKDGNSLMEGRYIDSDVINLIDSRYKDSFNVDPYFVFDSISKKHVTILPTYLDSVTTLSYHQVRFLKRIVEIYFKNEIEISHFIGIGE